MTYESECLGKVRYLTRKAAKQAIKRMPHRDHERRLTSYCCTRCGLWHNGRWHPNARMHAQQRRASQLQGD